MDTTSIRNNEQKWKYFLSSIKTFKNLQTNNLTIKTKSKIKCLATEFANKLLQKKGGTTLVTGKQDVLIRYKHLDVSKNQTKTPITKRNISLEKAETWPKSKDETIDNIDESSSDDSESLLANNDSVDSQDSEIHIPTKIAKTNENVQEKPDPISTTFINPLVKRFDDTKENVKQRSAQNADAIMPEVPQNNTNEHVKETSAQNTDAIITEVPQTDTNEHVKETSAQSADAIIPGVPQIDKNEHVKETSTQNAEDIIPEVPQTDTNEQVKETFAQNTDANMPELPHTDTNEHVNEASVHIVDANIEEEPQIYEPSRHIEVLVDDIPLISDDIEINRSRDRDTHTPSKKNDIDKACSSWNISSIAEYFSFDGCVTEIKMPTMFSSYMDDTYERGKNDIRLRLKIVKGIDVKARKRNNDSELLMQLTSITSTEIGSRLVLDALLVPLCSVLNLQFEVDKNINCNFLPNCRFDYCIRKGEHIIGCIEAKSVKNLSDKSVAQAVLQLMILQTTLIATETPEVDISEFPLFAIVTDGHRFIYMQLKGSFLGFEHYGGKVRIREVRQEGDFKDILRHISFLVDEAVGHLV